MEIVEAISCPYCGEETELALDTMIEEQRLGIDCAVCCRPFEVVVECEPGTVLSLQVQA
jgi:hypothetical protein